MKRREAVAGRYRRLPPASLRRLNDSLSLAEVFDGLEVRLQHVPSLRRPRDGGESGHAGEVALRQLDAEHPPLIVAGQVAEDAVAVVREVALHHDLALLQLGAVGDDVAGGAALRAPD